MKVTLLMALTVDGKIAKHANHFPDWTEKADKKMFKDITLKAGVVIMGSQTYDTIGKPLANRKNIVLTRNPRRKSKSANLVFTNDPPQKVLADLEAAGKDHAVLIGGAKINTLFAMEDLIDEMILTYCPKVFGTGLSLFSSEISMDLRLKEVNKIGKNSIAAKYAVIHPQNRLASR
jgi:dihydrofolate reductase